MADHRTLPDQFAEDPWPVVGFATTEHGALVAQRAATISETNGRASAYLATLSAALVALALVRRSAGMRARGRKQLLLTLAGLIAMVNSVVVGTLAGFLVRLVAGGPTMPVVVAVLVAFGAVAVQLAVQSRAFADLERATR